MKQFAMTAGAVAALSLIPVAAQASTHSFTSNCRFENGSSNLSDPNCQVTKTYDEARQWTGAQIRWSDGVVTEIEVQTINRSPSDRVDSRFGMAKIDGENAEYQTFSDGGICFVIDSNRNQLCYR
jgi:hypothetical protein